ncbi:hypothetical protein EEL32_07100 [Brevibacillus laterosporus]|uniref:Uncharacterized protein n=1 Tax=Brevibacillus laterosporus TaxID=1465 RepID=A0A502H8Y5_BRELA|nr:hypothetical protein [Brevibacillus laterosporus]QDX91370.1 hypothetical protein EEL30_02650 [Brevibacillus laterosporus]TPG69758.1 hypothetical protein EEL31_15545 [Brevibacillus laterosporus]TPG88955.1 hypothetical protein EEL32_07100 [Brevibacillus laterosporus]
MKKKLMATTMVFALCAMASSAFASQGVTGQIKTNVGTPSNVSVSNGVPLNAVPSNGVTSNVGNSNVANFGATVTVSKTSTAETAKQIGVTEKELLAYYAKYHQLNVNKPNQIKTLVEKQAELKSLPVSSPSEKLIQQWEQKRLMELIQQSKQFEMQVMQAIEKK